MATYVLVHGGAHGGWCYRDVAAILRSAGHDVHTPTLTGPHPFACFIQPLVLTHEADVGKLPQTHIVCTSTLATRDPARLAPARDAGRLWDIDTGHDLMITEPQAVADLLLRLA
jgi:hypothetical protein